MQQGIKRIGQYSCCKDRDHPRFRQDQDAGSWHRIMASEALGGHKIQCWQSQYEFCKIFPMIAKSGWMDFGDIALKPCLSIVHH